MILSKIYAVLVLLCMSVSVAANELATGDDVLLSDAENSTVFLEAEFAVTEWGEMQVTLHTDDVNAAQVQAMADYFYSFTDFVEIIDIHAPQSEGDQQNLSIHGMLPALILRAAQDAGDSPIGAQGQSEGDQQNLSIHSVLPSLILRAAEDPGDSPIGAQRH